MKISKLIVFFAFSVIIIVLFIVFLYLEFQNSPNYGSICTAIATLGLVLTAIYGFYSNREAVRLQTSLEFCFKVYKVFQSEEFKKRERRIQNGLMCHQGQPCAIEELKDNDLIQDIHLYCGYLDGIGVLVMEHLIRPEVIISYAGVGVLKTFYLLKPFLEISRKSRKKKAKEDKTRSDIDPIIAQSVSLYYANLELLALEMQRRGPKLIAEFNSKLLKARKKKRVIQLG